MTRWKRGIERMIESIKKNLKPKILISNLILIIGIVILLPYMELRLEVIIVL
ncbi:TPA: hypothetical protein ACY4R8_001840 [Clostridium perfringens]